MITMGQSIFTNPKKLFLGRWIKNDEKLKRDSNQHSLDVKMFILLQYISPNEKASSGNNQFWK